MRELKVCEFTSKSLTQVQERFNRALDAMPDCDLIFEIAEPFEAEGAWHAGFCYWAEQRKLKAV